MRVLKLVAPAGEGKTTFTKEFLAGSPTAISVNSNSTDAGIKLVADQAQWIVIDEARPHYELEARLKKIGSTATAILVMEG